MTSFYFYKEFISPKGSKYENNCEYLLGQYAQDFISGDQYLRKKHQSKNNYKASLQQRLQIPTLSRKVGTVLQVRKHLKCDFNFAENRMMIIEQYRNLLCILLVHNMLNFKSIFYDGNLWMLNREKNMS